MPILPLQQEKLEEYILPSGAKVKIDMSPSLTGDLLLYTDADNADARFMKWLVNRLKQWDFTEEDGSTVPINLTTIQRLPKADYGFLFGKHFEIAKNQISAQLDTAEKKSSSSTSTPSETLSPAVQG